MYFTYQIRQIKFKKKKLQRNARWGRRRKKKRKKIFNRWQKKRETYAQGEACSSTERAELREEMRGMRELALRRAERWDERNEDCAWDSEDPLLKDILVIALSPQRIYQNAHRLLAKMGLKCSKLDLRVLFIIIKRNFFQKVAFYTHQTDFWAGCCQNVTF